MKKLINDIDEIEKYIVEGRLSTKALERSFIEEEE